MTVTPQLYRKLVKAMDSRAVLISTSTALKAFQLKFVELLHLLDQSHTETKQFIGKDKEKKKWLEARKLVTGQYREQVQICVNILKLFRTGTFIIDEVDLILHPLKSELNFPIGRKEPLDLTLNKSQKGLRWEIPMFMLDAIFFASQGRMTVAMHGSREAEVTLEHLKAVIDEGYGQRDIQRTPHLILLSRAYYHLKVKPLLARWIVIWMSFRQANGLTDDQMYNYLMIAKDGSDLKSKAMAVGIKEELLSDEVMKLLNLAHDWLHSYMPFMSVLVHIISAHIACSPCVLLILILLLYLCVCVFAVSCSLGKIDRVSFGLLNHQELIRTLETDPKMPKSRRVTAIPFIGKDVPSQRSEFSHPDIVIGLTVLAFRYEGLRHVDFKRLMTTLQQNMWDEVGPYHKRPSSKLFAEWVKLAGGKVRGSRLESQNVKRKKEKQKKDELKKQQESLQEMVADPIFSDLIDGCNNVPPDLDADSATDTATSVADEDNQFSNIQRSHASATDIWPLRLIDFDDDEQYRIVYALMHKLPEMIYYYLRNFIFPPTMRHQGMKLAASGQDVGGEMLCNHRVGFSGTPSNLIPIELGKLNYEKGSDGQMIYYLTSTNVMSMSIATSNWTPRSLLLAMAHGNPSFSALIDTGALITGMTNLEVATFLMLNGLPDKEGIVFLDELDRKMILVRSTMSVLPLSQCGIPDTKRFAFYDQVHTTGIGYPSFCQCLCSHHSR